MVKRRLNDAPRDSLASSDYNVREIMGKWCLRYRIVADMTSLSYKILHHAH
jgi:hypothetical protein